MNKLKFEIAVVFVLTRFGQIFSDHFKELKISLSFFVFFFVKTKKWPQVHQLK
jgi:hypothetical protein